MRSAILFLVILLNGVSVSAQRVDSIFFHLYTDSLKKGQHNYINVDGKMPDGRWMPMTSKEIEFSSSSGRFEGNELILPADFRDKKITVRAVLKENPGIWAEKTIWVKQLADPPLPSGNGIPARKRNRQGG